MDGCENNPEKPSARKLDEYIPSGFSMSKILWFKRQNISLVNTKVKIALKSFVYAWKE